MSLLQRKPQILHVYEAWSVCTYRENDNTSDMNIHFHNWNSYRSFSYPLVKRVPYLKDPSSCCSLLVKAPKSGVITCRKPKPSNMYAYKMPTPLLPVRLFIRMVNLQPINGTHTSNFQNTSHPTATFCWNSPPLIEQLTSKL